MDGSAGLSRWKHGRDGHVLYNICILTQANVYFCLSEKIDDRMIRFNIRPFGARYMSRFGGGVVAGLTRVQRA